MVFDLDGVVTDTASVHRDAWKQLFDDWARRHREAGDLPGADLGEFTAEDYRRHVDGRPREEGVATFLAARGVRLPRGQPDDPPARETVTGLGRRKNAYFLDRLAAGGVRAYESTVRLVRALREYGVPVALVTASRNAGAVLDAAGLRELFDVVVDGEVAGRLGLAGKPDPATFVEAARRLGVAPARAAVVEDAVPGVEAGRRGGFGLVVGVDRVGDPEGLRRAGADVVVADLAELGDPADLGALLPRGRS